MIRTHYDNLQVTRGASAEVIRGAYRQLAQKWHPDKNPDNREEADRILQIINRAYAVLSDEERRKEHDIWIFQQEKKSSGCANQAALCHKCGSTVACNANFCGNCGAQAEATSPELTTHTDEKSGTDLGDGKRRADRRSGSGNWTVVPVWVTLLVLASCFGGIYWLLPKEPNVQRLGPNLVGNPGRNEVVSSASHDEVAEPSQAVAPKAGNWWDKYEDPKQPKSQSLRDVPADDIGTPDSANVEGSAAPQLTLAHNESVDATQLPLPKSGDFDSSRSSTETGILIRTSPGGGHTLVKVETVAGTEVTRAFIRQGQSYTVKLPYGVYVLKTASGHQWYGPKLLFGAETNYSKADDTFPLKSWGEIWEIELVSQINGNLTTTSLDKDQF